MDTLAWIIDKYKLDISQTSPIEIPNVGRDDLAVWFRELGFQTGVEVGTERGVYAEILCKANSTAQLYCVDLWECYTGYRDRKSNKEFVEIYQTAKERLSKYKVEMIREYSMDAVKHFPEDSLDFVYIDANHEYPWVTEDIVHWSKRVRPGGIVAGHDYYRSILKDSKCHVLAAVNGYTYAYRINPWFVLGTQARIPGQARDKSRSWMWVKE